ncbi:hypothetical protein ACFRFL_25210 [Streptomyces sp. NPDC056708]|uniref:hypothetical protein n=1 Tax=unclassified Streptomyces TaxID=2593676 RepID=UPI00369D24C8
MAAPRKYSLELRERAVRLCIRPGLPTPLCYRLCRHAGRKGERRSLSETDYIRLLDRAHRDCARSSTGPILLTDALPALDSP